MRIARWDNTKFVLIYCVVIGHLLNAVKVDSSFLSGLQFFIYLFHMPAFLFLSGLFSKRTIENRAIEKIIPYLMLYVFMKAFRFAVGYVLHGSVSGISLFSESGPPWYALTLFLSYLVTMICFRMNHTWLMVFVVMLGMMAGYDEHLTDFLTGMRFFTFYPFFLAGYCCPVGKLTELTEKKWIRIPAVLLLGGALGISLKYADLLHSKMNFLKGTKTYEKMGMLTMGGIYRGVYYLLVFLLVIAVIAVIPAGRSIASVWGSRSIQVFAVHFPIISILKKYLRLQELLSGTDGVFRVLIVLSFSAILTIVLSLKVWEPFFHLLLRPGAKSRKE